MARWSTGRRLLLALLVAMVVGLAVVVISERRAGLPRSATCDDVDPGGTRLRSAPPPTTRDAGGGRAGVRDGEVISPAFRPVSAEAVYCEDLADPFVVVDGTLRRRYLAYGTNTEDDHVPVLLSGGILRSESIAEGLPRLPAWSTPGAVWAPSVLRQDDVFVLYYATTHVASGRQCISRATASQPQGPFEDHSEGPLVCPTELGGAIDPSPFVAEDGATYLLWKADGNCCGMPTRIFIQPLSDDGLEVAGPPRELLGSTLPWEAGVVEAPAMVEHDGAVYLFYSGNAWNSASYAVGYARCDTPLGPCRKPLEGPWLASSPEAAGPGGQEFFTDRGALHMIFGAWLNGVVGYDSGSFRSLYTLEVSFRDGVPVVAE